MSYAGWCAALGLLAVSAFAAHRAWDRKQRAEETQRLSVEADKLLSTWDVRNYPSAAKNYERMISLGVEPHSGYWGLAHVALRQGGRKQYALDMLAKAIELKPDSCGAHGLLGYTLIVEHLRLRDGGRHLEEARRLCPASPGIATWWTALAAAQGRAAEALPEYQSLIAGAPARNSWLATSAILPYLSGRFEDAIHSTFESERAAPNPDGLLEWRGRSYLELGKTAEAVQAFVAGPFSEFAPETRAALSKRGPAAALETLLRATASEPHRLRHSYRRAHWLLALGRKNEALAELEFGFGPRPYYYWLAADPAFEPLRADPRFQALAARLKN
jgi:tetratricopeptide (TPR) repeat protein